MFFWFIKLDSFVISLKAEWKSCLEHETWFLFRVFHGWAFWTRKKGRWRCGFGATLRATRSSDVSEWGRREVVPPQETFLQTLLAVLCLEADHGGDSVPIALPFHFLLCHFSKCNSHEHQEPDTEGLHMSLLAQHPFHFSYIWVLSMFSLRLLLLLIFFFSSSEEQTAEVETEDPQPGPWQMSSGKDVPECKTQ